MPGSRAVSAPDRGQRRASLAQARSKETKRALVQAAMALWRTSGYATTTVADICRAAGVSKALFYFYFPRKEDVLFEVGVMSTRSAQRVVADMLVGDYDMPAVIAAALSDLERSMARNPRELIIETILEATATNTGSWRIPPADSAATPPPTSTAGCSPRCSTVPSPTENCHPHRCHTPGLSGHDAGQ